MSRLQCKFKSLLCYRRHLENKQCERTKVCNDCGIMYTMIRKGFQHKCGTIYCKICRDYVEQPHYCYIKVASKPQTIPRKDIYVTPRCRRRTLVQLGVSKRPVVEFEKLVSPRTLAPPLFDNGTFFVPNPTRYQPSSRTIKRNLIK
jgi:hypothetical protein